MEQVNLGYSTKNIPLPSKKDYLQRLISSTEKFIRSIRWRTYFYLNPAKKTSKKETYGFTTTRTPPKCRELNEFEDGLLNLVQNIEFKHVETKFQKQMSKDAEKIKKSDLMLIPADKTTNFYKVKPDQYTKLLDDNVTKTYKKAPAACEIDISTEDKRIATELELADRIDVTAKNEAFVTLKDHKPNFNNKPSCRLINPTKSEIGKISKQILEKINYQIKNATKFNQWKNTDEVINWYNKIRNKPSYSFICFDVCEFYPSITEELLTKALEFAAKHIEISEEDKHIITHAKKSLLYNNKTPWHKKSNDSFDVTMGSFDGAETCELIGLYILSQLQDLDINVGLYRDDGLAVSRKTPRQTEQTKKDICKIFHKNNLKITIEANLKSVDFLDITMDLRTETHKPYMKPNNTPLYVHKKSNHPPNILKNIPDSINRRLSNISSNENIFKEAIPPYQEALRKSGYNYEFKYAPKDANRNESNNNNSRRKRRVTWFNPPYSQNVTTNVGKSFLKLLDKCFPPDNHLHKLLNRNTVKVSYSCMSNIKQTISSHNKAMINKSEPNGEDQENCNCRRKAACPLNNKCNTSSVVYQATVTREDNNTQETYIGLTVNSFKCRYTVHTNTFKDPTNRNKTTLSQHIWKLKDNKIPYAIKWKIVARGRAYSSASKKCHLCIKEKYFIICKPDMSTLNKRNELASECRHRKRHLLSQLN